MHELESNELESALLKAGDDVADDAPLNTIGLRSNC